MALTNYNRRDFLKYVGAGLAGSALIGCGSGKMFFGGRGKRPNILFIMSDDHSANAVSCYGGVLSEVAKTPNIDRIAAEGMRLNNCFCTNSICSPSRATILTGKYSHKNGLAINYVTFDGGQRTVAKLLQGGGYETAMIGKWHLKSEPTGFDYWNILMGQGRYHDPILVGVNKGKQTYKGYVTDVVTDISLEWLKGRERSRPFFLMCHHKAPHEPWGYDKKHAEYYKGIDIPEHPSLWDDHSGHKQGGPTIHPLLSKRMKNSKYGRYGDGSKFDVMGMDYKQAKKAAYQRYLKDYLRCIASVDDNVGRLIDYLKNEGMFDDTVVIYTSDQGMFLGEHGWFDKRKMFEESLRMPFVVRYPREIAGGSVCEEMALNVDFAETFLDYAGVRIPADMQGRSLRSLLRGRRPNDWRSSMFYAYYEGGEQYGVRTKRYKLICYKEGYNLFDLKEDPLELNSVYGDPEYSDVKRKLEAELKGLMKELDVKAEDLPIGWRGRNRAIVEEGKKKGRPLYEKYCPK
ncbi:MAG: sulfatase-like hydrolase/transferase [Planctomycetota bacterium]|jgi:arylsulfatase A-like enzyme